MATPRDRLRRILLEGEAELPVERPKPKSALRRRLEALQVEGDLPPPEPAYDGRTLDEAVSGVERETAKGVFLFLEKRIPLSTRHGNTSLRRAAGQSLPLRHGDGWSSITPEEVVFLDTETTGLSGGTGTVAFLVGTGRLEGDALVVRQYCMRDYPEEPALLEALAEDLGTLPLATFNGRSFDWPLLRTRWQLQKAKVSALRPHLDLLPASRRLWPAGVSSHRLQTLEKELLGLGRVDDLPSHEVPRAYFDYLRTGRPDELARAFHHNEVDVVSMLALMGLIGRTIEHPEKRTDPHPKDQIATARLLDDLGRPERARACLESALPTADEHDLLPLLRALGHSCRRARMWDEALGHFRCLADQSPALDLEAWEQVAKILEHRRRDPGAALAVVETVMPRVARGSRAEEALRHREARLRRKLGAH